MLFNLLIIIMNSKTKRFNRIIRDIKSVKIQGATNIAKASLTAYSIFPTGVSKKKLLSARPTEPMMEKVLELAEKTKDYKKILLHFKEAQDRINKKVSDLIKNNDVVLT